MNTSFSIIYRITAAVLALLLLAGCTAPTEPTTPTEPHKPCHEPFEPIFDSVATTDITPTVDDAFAGSDVDVQFTYEEVEGGLRLTAYTGEGGRIIIPDEIGGVRVVALGDGLFRDNTALLALSIPASVTDIGTDLLTGCRSIQALRIPQLGAKRTDTDGHLSYFFGQASPEGTGFRVPSTLDTVALLDTVTAIPDNAFLDCERVKWVFLPDTLTEIGSYAFSGCSQLNHMPLPDSLLTIGERAFEGCSSLSVVTLPASLERVGLGAYAGCTKLGWLTLPFVGETREHDGYIGHLFGAEAYQWNASHLPSSLVYVTLTEGDVPDYAFYGCDRLERVELSERCTTVGVRAFWGCTSLQTLVLPDSVHTVGDLALAHCSTLYRVTLGNGLTSLGLSAFMGCTNLTEIAFPDTLQALPASVLADCCNLRTVTLGANLREIGAMAFRNCVSLASATGGGHELHIAQGNEPLTSFYP